MFPAARWCRGYRIALSAHRRHPFDCARLTLAPLRAGSGGEVAWRGTHATGQLLNRGNAILGIVGLNVRYTCFYSASHVAVFVVAERICEVDAVHRGHGVGDGGAVVYSY